MPARPTRRFSDTDADHRRLVLLLYALVGPSFMAALALAAEPASRARALAVVGALIVTGGAWTALRPAPKVFDWVFPVAVSPVVCCGVAFASCGAAGLGFLAVMAAPVAWASVLLPGVVTICAWVTATLTCLAALLQHGSQAVALWNTLLFSLITGLVAWVVHGKSKELRETKAELVRTGRLNQAMIEAIPDTLSWANREGRFLGVHSPPNEVLPLGAELLVGHTVYEFLPPEVVPRVKAAIAAALEGGALQTVDYSVAYPGGVHSFEARIARSGGDEVVVIRRDVTSLRESERQREELHRSLERRVAEAVSELRAKDQLLITQSRQAAMGEMLANIAHQWRQPLNALALLFANLRDASRFGELDGPTLEKGVEDGKRLIKKMSTTIDDFRNFARPDAERRPFSARRQIRDIFALVDGAFRSAGITLAEEGTLDLELIGFPNQYSQILLNLLSNAREAIEGAGRTAGRVTVEVSERDGLGCVTVRDDGGGIPEAVLARLFEPYFTTKASGTGIGLYMSKQIIERNMGGRLGARNVEGGCAFDVLAPLADPARAGAGPRASRGA